MGNGRRRPGRRCTAPLKLADALGLAAVFAAESLLFILVTHHHYAWSYPAGSDQLQYLGEAYRSYERARQQGFAEGAWLALTHISAQGSLHGFFALLVFEVAGPSRTAALMVNLIGFLLWQGATFGAVRRLSGSRPLAWASIGLLAALHSPWSGGAGSAVDFRLDWMAACAYGVALAVGVAGNGFRSTRWAALFGLAIGLVLMTRFLTAAYFGVIFLILLAGLLTGEDRMKRCGRLMLSGTIALGLSAPSFWRARHTLYDYYWVDHFAGPARALNDSHFGALSSIRWMLSQLVFEQVGPAALILGLGAAVAFAALRHFNPRPDETPSEPVGDWDGAGWVAWAFFGAPAIILLLHPIKAPQTLGILLPGAVWIVILAWMRCARHATRSAVALAGAAVAVTGALLFVVLETRTGDADRNSADFRNINALGDYVFFRAEEAGLPQPRVGVTWQLDSLSAETFQLLGYERHQRLLPMVATLPTGRFATTDENVMRALAESDLVCLVTRAPLLLPFDRQMARLLPQMAQWCETHLAYAGHLETAAFAVSVYERRALGRPPGSAVGLASLTSAGSRGPAYSKPVPPAAPLFVSPALVLGSTAAQFRYSLALAAYSPIAYRVADLPEGLILDADAGQIRGRCARTGDFVAKITATNSLGSASAQIRFHIEGRAAYGFLDAPKTIGRDTPVTINFGAFDASGNLDFIDVTDLTTGKTLERLPAYEGQRQVWLGAYRTTFRQPGPHSMLFRIVRFNPDTRAPYTFDDHSCEIAVAP
jgi:hypothetical protein